MEFRTTTSTIFVIVAIVGAVRRIAASENVLPQSTVEWVLCGVAAVIVVTLVAFIVWMIATVDD